MLAAERKERIIEMLDANKTVKVTDLSKIFSTTEATIRRDLDELARDNMLRRIHGGAIALPSASKSFYISEIVEQCSEEKKMIADFALHYIKDDDAIILDSSTTCMELAIRIAESNYSNLSIITNSFGLLKFFENHKNISVIHTGGNVFYDLNCATGLFAEQMIKNVRVDKCFIGTNGIDSKYGYSVPTLNDASLKKAILFASHQCYVLADHTKFGESYMGKFAEPNDQVHYLITDYVPKTFNINTISKSTKIKVIGEPAEML